MPHPFAGGTAFTQFTNRPNLLPPDTEPTGTLRRSLCKPSIENLPTVGAPFLAVTFIPTPATETLIITEPWEDVLIFTLIFTEEWETPPILITNIFSEEWEASIHTWFISEEFAFGGGGGGG